MSNPTLDRSTITSCTFTSLTPSTRIERSALSHTTVAAPSGDPSDPPSRIDRSTVAHSELGGCRVERSKLDRCRVWRDGRVERSELRGCGVLDGGKVERCVLVDCEVLGGSSVERVEVGRRVVVERGSRVARSRLLGGRVSGSRVERCELEDCEVVGCEVERSCFRGMVMRYGVWERGRLVGRTDETREVVFRKKDEVEAPKQEIRDGLYEMPEEAPDEGAVGGGVPSELESDTVGEDAIDLTPTESESEKNMPQQSEGHPDIGNALHIHLAHAPDATPPHPTASEEKARLAADEVVQEDDAYSRATGMTDEDYDFDSGLDDVPPPAYEG